MPAERAVHEEPVGGGVLGQGEVGGGREEDQGTHGQGGLHAGGAHFWKIGRYRLGICKTMRAMPVA